MNTDCPCWSGSLWTCVDRHAAGRHPPAGPYAYALGSTEKLLVTTEWNNGLPPGTAVRCMGLKVEDSLWVYEVSPDRQQVYFLPWIHLAPIRGG